MGGLMQCNGDTGFPLTDQNGNIINHTMTSDDINRMVLKGAQHFAGNLSDVGPPDFPFLKAPANTRLQFNGDFWSAVWEYNSGSVDPGDLDVQAGGFGVASYVTDIGNLLHGFIKGSQPERLFMQAKL
jgi:hypothetical protein